MPRQLCWHDGCPYHARPGRDGCDMHPGTETRDDEESRGTITGGYLAELERLRVEVARERQERIDAEDNYTRCLADLAAANAARSADLATERAVRESSERERDDLRARLDAVLLVADEYEVMSTALCSYKEDPQKADRYEDALVVLRALIDGAPVQPSQKCCISTCGEPARSRGFCGLHRALEMERLGPRGADDE